MDPPRVGAHLDALHSALTRDNGGRGDERGRAPEVRGRRPTREDRARSATERAPWAGGTPADQG